MIKVLVFIKKLEGTDRAHLQHYYETHHAPLVNRLLPFYCLYRRNYLDEAVRSTQPVDVGCDVVTELGFASQAEYDGWLEALSDPEVIRQIREDERNFIDQSATRMLLVTPVADDLPERPCADRR
jgi:uncharacterized protein (TIGR02118 family)